MDVQAARFLTEAIGHSQEAVLITDVNGLITYGNAAAALLFNLSESEMHGADLLRFLRNTQSPQYPIALRQSINELVAALPMTFFMADPVKRQYQLQCLSLNGVDETGGRYMFYLRELKAEIRVEPAVAMSSFMADNGLAMVVRYAPDTTLTSANDFFMKKVANAGQEVIGHSFSIFLPEDAFAEVYRAVQGVTPEKPTFYSINKIYDARGEVIWTHWFNHCSFDEYGKPVEFYAVGFDMSELEAYKRRFELTEDLAGIAYWSYRPAEDRLDYSPQFLKVCGIKDGSAMTLQAFKRLIVPADFPVVEKYIHTLWEDQIPFTYEFRLQTPGDNYRYVQMTAKTEIDKQGNAVKVYGVIQDITDLKQLRDAYQDTQKSLDYSSSMAANLRRTIDEHSIMSVTDTRGRIIYVNDLFCKISGYPSRELIGHNHRMIKSGVHDQAFYREMWKTISSGKTWQGEICNKAKNGELYWVHSTIVPFLDKDGKPFQYVSVRTDITALKKNQQALIIARDMADAASLAKSRFLANTSHELRTPLNAILGFSELMKDEAFGELPAAYQSYADNIYDSGARLLSAVESILDMTAMEAGDISIDYVEVKITDLIWSNVVPVISHYVESRKLKLDVLISEDLPIIHADQKRIAQALCALADNACKFNVDGGFVRIRADRYGDEHIAIHISDTGIGMYKEEIQRLLEPFAMADESRSRHEEGLGLGLSLAKGIIEFHSGSLRLKSQPGDGTTATIILPIKHIGNDQKNAVLGNEI